MNTRTRALLTTIAATAFFQVQAWEISCYMGGEVTLETAPNGVTVNAGVLKTSPEILYLEPTTEKIGEGNRYIGGSPSAIPEVGPVNDHQAPHPG